MQLEVKEVTWPDQKHFQENAEDMDAGSYYWNVALSKCLLLGCAFKLSLV